MRRFLASILLTVIVVSTAVGQMAISPGRRTGAVAVSMTYTAITPGNHCSGVQPGSVNTINCTVASIPANSLVIATIFTDDDGSKTFAAPTATGLTFTAAGPLEHYTNESYQQNFCAYTSSALGSTAVTETWTGTADDASLLVASFTGTAASCLAAIGGSAGATAETVTVGSTGSNNSQYYGVISKWGGTVTVGTGYTTVVSMTSNGSSIEGMSELSTTPVSPAANTTVDFSGASSPAIIGLELIPLASSKSIFFVQQAQCSTGSLVTTLTCTFASPVTAGDILIASAMPLLTPGAAAFPVTVSDTVNSSWSSHVNCYSAFNAQSDFFYFNNTSGGSDTVTLTYNLSTVSPHDASLYLSIAEYNGQNTTTPFDVVPTCSSFLALNPTQTGPTITTTVATDLLLSTLSMGNAGTTTASSPYIDRITSGVTLADSSPGTTGAQTGPTWTLQFSQDGFVIDAALKAQ